MNNVNFLLLAAAAILPLTVKANDAPSDTTGKKVSRIQKVTETTTYVKKMVDGVPSFDTVHTTETTEETKTEYAIAPSLWQLGTEFSIGLNQVAFQNWVGGGIPSYSVLLANKSFATYRKNSSVWKTDFDLKYGIQQQGEEDWFKNNDQLKIYSIYGYKAASTWNYSALLDFQTQLSKGYTASTDPEENYVSKFLSPMYLTFSVGMEYENVPKTASIFLTPVAYKLTYVGDTTLSTKYGIDAHQHALSMFGPMAVFINKHKLSKNISFDSKLSLLADLLAMEDPFISAQWNVGLNIDITKHLKIKILFDMIYDPNIIFEEPLADGTVKKSRKIQLRESLFLNFVYNITN